ncbi:MFS transporter [Streptomyces sp. JB150]|uniref:MFS transporter n=1 Tax=Streptomyces sp. JB150 TaxID=2714844 RepID=UPI00140C79D8|nr:MFS transporter [Streptomyces sp. JB150]QIJ60851.1 MFS transporter [Streptomyces sp. JB150]
MPFPQPLLSPGSVLVAVSGAWGVFWGTWSALLPAVLERAGTSPAEFGLVLTAVPLGAMPAMAVVGRLAVGREPRALLLTAFSLAAGIVLLGGVSGPAGLGAALLVVGATSGALDVCLNSATARVERTTGRPLFQAVHAAFPVAVIAAAPLTGLARQAGVGIPAVLLVCAVLQAASALPLLRPAAVGGRREEGEGRGKGGAGPAAGPVRRAGPAWRSAWVWGSVLGALGGCVLVVENAVEQWSVLLLEEHRDAPAALASAAPALYMGALTVSRLAVQRMKWPRTRDLVLLGAVGGCGGIAWAALAPAAWLSLTGFAVCGLALGPLMPALLGHAGRTDPSGYTVSVVSAVSYVAFLVSPLFVGSLTRWVSLPVTLACLSSAAVPLLAAAAVARWRPAWARPRTPADR